LLQTFDFPSGAEVFPKLDAKIHGALALFGGGSESAALHLHHPSRPALTILSQSSIQSCLACSSQRQHGATAIGKGQKQLHQTSPDPGTPFLAPYGSGEVPSLEKAGEG